MRALAVFVSRLLLRIYFRRIEVEGLDRIPSGGPLVFAGNHPNGLLDPLFVLCLAPRRVSFLAKEPLFRMPFVRWFIKGFECLPVYRAKDGAEPAEARRRNREMIQSAVDLLARGNALAIFPEGISHTEPNLQPLRPGAARLAISASSLGDAPAHIVPCGLTYEAKDTFRSVALAVYGEPIEAPAAELDEAGNPPREAVKALTEKVREGLEAVTFTAPTHDALELAHMVEALLGDVDGGAGKPAMVRRVEVRQQIVEGIEVLGRDEPEALGALAARVRQFHQLASTHHAPVGRHVEPPRGPLVGRILLGIGVLLLLAPLALAGLLTNYVTYRAVGLFATRYAKGEDDIVSTAKAVLGLLMYPVTWLLWGAGVAWALGDPWGLMAGPAVAVAGYVALVSTEQLEVLIRRVRTLRVSLGIGTVGTWLTEERAALRAEILALGDRLPSSP